MSTIPGNAGLHETPFTAVRVFGEKVTVRLVGAPGARVVGRFAVAVAVPAKLLEQVVGIGISQSFSLAIQASKLHGSAPEAARLPPLPVPWLAEVPAVPPAPLESLAGAPEVPPPGPLPFVQHILSTAAQ